MKSRFGRHLVFWLFIAPVVVLLVLPAIPRGELFRLGKAEQAANLLAMGEAEHAMAQRRAVERFRRWFVEPGWVQGSYTMLAPRREEVLGVERTLGEASSGWIDRTWLALYRAFYRLEVSLRWYEVMLVVAGAAFIDGLVRRRIRTHELGYNNPVVFHLMTHLLIAIAGLLSLAPFLPLAVPLAAWPLAVIAVAAAAWVAAVNFQTGG